MPPRWSPRPWTPSTSKRQRTPTSARRCRHLSPRRPRPAELDGRRQHSRRRGPRCRPRRRRRRRRRRPGHGRQGATRPWPWPPPAPSAGLVPSGSQTCSRCVARSKVARSSGSMQDSSGLPPPSRASSAATPSAAGALACLSCSACARGAVRALAGGSFSRGASRRAPRSAPATCLCAACAESTSLGRLLAPRRAPCPPLRVAAAASGTCFQSGLGGCRGRCQASCTIDFLSDSEHRKL